MGHCKLTARECLFSYELFQIQIREAVAESQLQRQGRCQKTKKKTQKKAELKTHFWALKIKIMINFQ